MAKWDISLAAAALGLSISFREIGVTGIHGFLLTDSVGLLRIIFLLAGLCVCVKTGLFEVWEIPSCL